jgi:hypothetical protein
MDLLRIFIGHLLFVSVNAKVLPIESKESLVPTAIAEIVESFQHKHSMNFDFIIYKSPLDDLVNEIAKSVKKITIITETVDLSANPESSKLPYPPSYLSIISINQSAILFFNDEKNFKNSMKMPAFSTIFLKTSTFSSTLLTSR